MEKKHRYLELQQLGESLVKCELNCNGISNDFKTGKIEGIIPRCSNIEFREGVKSCIVVGLNPGKSDANERKFYLSNSLSYKSTQDYFKKSIETKHQYYIKTRALISELGYNGDILWTELVKCECSGKNGELPVQTLRACINKFLKKEIELFHSEIIFALGNQAFEFCALSFPNHLVIGLPHPTGAYGDKMGKLTQKIKNSKQYSQLLEKLENDKKNKIALKLMDEPKQKT